MTCSEFAKCYANADKPNDCALQRDDYMECLHHTKEVRTTDSEMKRRDPRRLTSYNYCLNATPYQSYLQTGNSQIKRAQTIKSHYLESERKRLAQKKQEAEEKAAVPGGIMGLNLIGYDNDDSNGNGNGGAQGVKQPTQDSKAGEKAPKEGIKQAS